MKNYVLCFAKTVYDSILLIEKQRPDWQKGRFNLVGGKIEEGETPKQAAIREFSEEAKIFNTNPIEAGLITGSWGNVYCFAIPIRKNEIVFNDYPMISDGEKVFWETWDKVKNNPRLIPNLKVIIPLCINEMYGWKILDEGTSSMTGNHNFEITVPVGA